YLLSYNNPLPTFRDLFSSWYLFTKPSRIPLINILLFGVEYSLAISIYSLIVTLNGIEGNFKNSQIAIFKIIVSISAIRSLSQLGVLSIYSTSRILSFKTVFLKICFTKSL